MSFRVQDLVIHVKKVEAFFCRPSCLGTQDLVGPIAKAVGEENHHLVQPICDNINAQIKVDPTQEELKMLAEELQAALDVVRSQIEQTASTTKDA
jgi:hypothetical protein